jgi:hypothetical protein
MVFVLVYPLTHSLTHRKVTKVQSGGAERSLKKMSEYKVGLKTDYKAYYQPNKEVVTQSKKAQKAGAASDDTLKLYFRKFTERFLEPLESYLDTLLPSVSYVLHPICHLIQVAC